MPGVAMSEGSRFLGEHNVSAEDQELTRRYKAAGLVIFGKTNTPEFGLLPTTEPELFGPTRNPWDTTRTPGGSSGGAAAAVASGLVPAAHANDGGGSIRIPASCCGIFGLKPSRGRNSQGPHYGDIAGGIVAEHVVSRYRARQRGPARRHRGTSAGRSLLGAPPRAAVRGGGRRRSRAGCGSRSQRRRSTACRSTRTAWPQRARRRRSVRRARPRWLRRPSPSSIPSSARLSRRSGSASSAGRSTTGRGAWAGRRREDGLRALDLAHASGIAHADTRRSFFWLFRMFKRLSRDARRSFLQSLRSHGSPRRWRSPPLPLGSFAYVRRRTARTAHESVFALRRLHADLRMSTGNPAMSVPLLLER